MESGAEGSSFASCTLCRNMGNHKKTQIRLYLLVGLIVLLLFVLVRSGDQEAKIRTLEVKQEKYQQEIKKELDKRFDKLEKDIKKLKISEAQSTAKKSKTATIQPPQQPAVRLSISCEQYRPLVAQYSWPVDIVLAIMYAESGCNPNAISPTDDHGLMQLHGIRIYDPAENIAYAYNEKYLKGGFSHWTVCNVGIVKCW